jgi:hypothetical protein
LAAADLESAAQLSARLSALVTEAKAEGHVVRVVVADRLCRVFMVTPPANALRITDLEAAARGQMARLFGAQGDWVVSADWQGNQAFLASAMPSSLTSAIQAMAVQTDLQIASLQPHFVQAQGRCHAQLAAGDWFAVLEDHHLSVAIFDQTGIASARSTQLSTDTLGSADGLRAWLVQEGLRRNALPPAQLKLSGDVPASWLSRAASRSDCLALDREPNASSRPLPGHLLAIAGGQA